MSDRLYYHSTCPLCPQGVDLWQTEHYRVLPLDDKKTGILKKPVYNKNGLIEVDGHRIGWDIQYLKLSCMAKTWGLNSKREDRQMPRFTISTLNLTGPVVQIHLISVGGCPYTSNLPIQSVAVALMITQNVLIFVDASILRSKAMGLGL